MALLVVGCGTRVAPFTQSAPVALRTQSAPTDHCDDGLFGGTLEVSATSGLAVRGTDGRGQLADVLWPYGYSAIRDGTGIVLRDASGNEIARQGETITMAGGFGADGVWAACPGTVHSAPTL